MIGAHPLLRKTRHAFLRFLSSVRYVTSPFRSHLSGFPDLSRNRLIDAALVRQARDGDEAAFEAIVRQLDPMLRAWFVSRVGQRAEVDDLVQNTLLRLHRGLPDLHDPHRLEAFVMKAAVFETQDYYRGRYGSRERLAGPDVLSRWSETAPDADVRMDAERALGLLSEKARTILEMREYGYRYAEIARSLDMTEAAVKMQVKRALRKLRKELGESAGEDA